MADKGMVIRIAASIEELKRNLTEGRQTIETTTAAMTKLANSLTGEKLIQNAHNIVAAVDKIGGATKLTESEKARLNATLSKALEKYQVLGKEAPAAMVALQQATTSAEQPTQTLTSRMVALGAAVGSFIGTFAANLVQRGISSLVSWGTEAFNAAGRMTDLSAQTGLSVRAIQEFQFVAQRAGTELDTLTTSAFALQRRIGAGSDSVRKAVEDLGLSFAELRRQSPEEQFRTVLTAIGNLDSQTDRASLGFALFGRRFQDMAVITEKGYAAMADGAVIASDEQIAALDKASDAWDDFVTNTQSRITSWLGSLVLAAQDMRRWDIDVGEAAARIAAATGGITEDYESQTRALAAYLATATQASVTQDSYVAKLAAVQAAVQAVTEAERAEIAAALQLGVSVEELSDRFGLSEEAIRMLSTQLKDNAAATREAEQVMKAYTDSVDKMVSAHDSAIASLANKLFGFDDIERAQRYMEALGGVENVSMLSGKAQEELANVMRAGVEAMVAAGLSTDELTGQMEVFRLAATQTGTDAAVAMQLIENSSAEAARSLAQVSEGLTIIGQTAPRPQGNFLFGNRPSSGLPGGSYSVQQIQFPQFGTPAPPSSLAQTGVVVFGGESRAHGGPVSAGQPYLVGEHGPELFMPGASGAIAPNGGGGPTITIAAGAVQINYPLMNDPRARTEIAAMVGDALMARLRQQGLRVPSGA